MTHAGIAIAKRYDHMTLCLATEIPAPVAIVTSGLSVNILMNLFSLFLLIYTNSVNSEMQLVIY